MWWGAIQNFCCQESAVDKKAWSTSAVYSQPPGSAGCVVAARIAENKNFNILLLEAGPDCQPCSTDVPLGVQDSRRVPMKGQSEIFDPNIDWDVKVTLPEGKSMYVPQARVVGGGSSINGGTALRNTMADSKDWVALGNDAWDFNSVCQIYESLEGDQHRNTRGPHPITRATTSELGQIQLAFLDGAVATGFCIVEDFKDTGVEDIGPSPVCRQGDRRISAANTFVDSIRDLSNFTIMSDAHVEKLLISDGQTCAVLLASGHQFHASHEIIVCAGAIFSPAILQRSGIGPPSLLRSLQIPLVAGLSVGENLADHPCIPVVARPRNDAYQDQDYSLQLQARWSSSQKPGSIDSQMVCFSYLFAASSDPTNQARSLAGTAIGHVAGIGCNVNKPTSLGKTVIQSKDAYVHPSVTPNYLQTDDDRRVAREIVRCAYRVIKTLEMQKVLEEPLTISKEILADDDLLNDWIMAQVSSTYHFSGSCKMGNSEIGGVVDQSGRVHGLRGLRVADASIIPTIPASNTMWTAMMFAERIGCSVRDAHDVRPLRDSNII